MKPIPLEYSQSYQIVFGSELPTGFQPIEGQKPNVVIRRATLERISSNVPWTLREGILSLDVPGVARYQLKGPDEILVDADPEVPAYEVQLPLRSTLLSPLLAQRGCLPIHACAFDTPSGAVLIAGRCGNGKSTLLAGLRRRGYPILCDSLSPIRWNDGQIELIPDGPGVELMGTVLHYFGEDLSRLAPIRPGVARYRTWQPFKSLTTPKSRPIRALIFMGLQDSPGCEMLSLDKRSALTALTGLVYRWRMLEGMNQRQEMLETLTRSAISYTLTAQRGLQYLDTTIDEVVARLKSLAPEKKHWTQELQLPRIELYSSTSVATEDALKGGFLGLSSYPKSGNTWVRALLTAWRRQAQHETDLSYLEGGGQIMECHTFEEEMGIKASQLRFDSELQIWRSRLHREFRSRLDEPMPVKLHERCTRLVDGNLIFPSAVLTGIVYIVRCPLDVVGSHANHFGLTLEQAVRSMKAENTWIHPPGAGHAEMLTQPSGSWKQHVTSWLDEPENRLLLVRYEDLLADTQGELKRMVEFCGDEWDPLRGAQVVEICKFERLQAKEQESGFKERPEKSPVFFRQGKAGGWRDTLPPELAREICIENEEVMRRLGYGAEVDEVLGVPA